MGRTAMGSFGTVQTASGLVALRDLETRDTSAIVDYWTKSPPEFLEFMGVDRGRLGGEAEITARLSQAIRTGDAAQASIALGITLDKRLVGYTLLNRYSDEENYSHWHIIVPEMRGKGISTGLYPLRIKTYFDVAPIARLIHQTRTRNVAVNRMLDKFVSVAETKQIEKPDGVAMPGEFNLRYVRREGVASILRRAEKLGIQPKF
jgi:RimJ/RimL family protein N-acetyltransferase